MTMTEASVTTAKVRMKLYFQQFQVQDLRFRRRSPILMQVESQDRPRAPMRINDSGCTGLMM